MNVILFTKRRGHLHQLSLAQPRVLLPACVLAIGLALGLFWGGYQTAVTWGAAHPDAAAQMWKAELKRQQKEIQAARREARENLQALSVRLGKLQAHVTRLDALGKRLTQMAGLDEGEFDFDRAPAQGGPEGSLAESGQRETDDFMESLDELARQIESRGDQLSVLEHLLLNRRVHNEVQPAGQPVRRGWMSSDFGLRRDPFTGRLSRHYGLDFAAREGADVVAVAAGVVSWASERYGYGKLVEINHGGGYKTRYGHNKRIVVEVGDKVTRGQTIGKVGSSGRSTGPHVHFEVLYNGKAINPEQFIHASR